MGAHEPPIHLDKKGIIETGAFYTPRELVDEVGRLVCPYVEGKDKVIIFDNSVGGGAFTQIMEGLDFRLADCDIVSCEKLSRFADRSRIFHTNSLHDVSREKYKIPGDAFLIQVGNPPYNDTTSAYKKGEKGKNLCDEDLFDRDLGVSFLRSFDKLNADVVCVLHPLAYLIKEANFKRLKGFRQNYKLTDAVVFSSELFHGTGSAKFPIIIGLYVKHHEGMSYQDIREFPFRVWNQEHEFRLNQFETTDSTIRKYPPRKNDPKESSLGLYYYTFRDVNSLKRSASFQEKSHYNAIPVTLENLYQYCYLFAFKTLFQPDAPWLYGNLSPIFDSDFLDRHRSEFVEFAMCRHPVFEKLGSSATDKIREFYSIPREESKSRTEKIEDLFQQFFKSLV